MVFDPKIQLQAQAELELRRRRQERPADFTPEFVSDSALGASIRPGEPRITTGTPFGPPDLRQPPPGILQGLVGNAFDALGFKPVTDEQAKERGLSTFDQVVRNFNTGAIRGIPEFLASIPDAVFSGAVLGDLGPAGEIAKGLVKFIPEQVETVSTALGTRKASERINERTGLVQRQKEVTPEQVAEARKELRLRPEGPVFAALLGRGAAGGVKRLAKPKKAPVRASEAAPVKSEPVISEQKAVTEFFEEQPVSVSKAGINPPVAGKSLIDKAETKPVFDPPKPVPEKAELLPKKADVSQRTPEPQRVTEIKEVQPDVPKSVATSRQAAEATPVAGKPLKPTKVSTAEVATRTETVNPRDISPAILEMRTFQKKISVSKTGFDQSIQKKLVERGKTINRDKSLTPKQKRVKRQALRSLITKVEAESRDIATRKTKAGNIRGSIRRSGVFVPGEFARYENFKDIKGRLSKDPTVAIQEMDGALSVEAKAKLPGQEGPAEQFILRRTQDMTVLRNRFNADNTTRLKTISSGLSTKQRKVAFRVLDKISRKDATLEPTELAKRSSISKTTTDPKVIRFAQESRKVFDDLLDLQNEFRRDRNQPEIKRRAFYSPDMLRDITIWDKAQFWDKSPREIIAKPELPDFIKPNKPFNPRELAKKGLLEEFEKVDDLGTLLENYSNTASRDIFNTSIIQNNKAFAEQLRSMGLEGSARYIEDWTAEAFAGVKAGVDRSFHVGKTASKVMNRFRSALNRSVFPLNFTWNLTIQTSSSALTTMRYGFKNSLTGAFDWFGSKAFRKEIETKAYSAIIKRDKGSRITQQDSGVGSTGRIKFRESKLDNVIDAANFFTEWTERHLTGWSVATARRHGQNIGLRDRALWDYASDGGAKTQSMYNFEDAPPILRNQLVKTIAPFQTFSFTMWNTIKEFAGKAGTPPATFRKRAAWALRFAASISAINYIGSQITNREPWDLRGFVPFYSFVFGPIEAKITDDRSAFTQTRQLPSPVGIVAQLADGFEELITKGKWDKLRQWMIKFGSGWLGIPAGTQMNKTVEGLIAISEGGDLDAAGRMKYPITEVDDKLIAITMGKYATPGGRAYLDKRANERKMWADRFLKPNPLNLILDKDADRTDMAPLRLVKPRETPKPRE